MTFQGSPVQDLSEGFSAASTPNAAIMDYGVVGRRSPRSSRVCALLFSYRPPNSFEASTSSVSSIPENFIRKRTKGFPAKKKHSTAGKCKEEKTHFSFCFGGSVWEFVRGQWKKEKENVRSGSQKRFNVDSHPDRLW